MTANIWHISLVYFRLPIFTIFPIILCLSLWCAINIRSKHYSTALPENMFIYICVIHAGVCCVHYLELFWLFNIQYSTELINDTIFDQMLHNSAEKTYQIRVNKSNTFFITWRIVRFFNEYKYIKLERKDHHDNFMSTASNVHFQWLLTRKSKKKSKFESNAGNNNAKLNEHNWRKHRLCWI